MIQRFQIEDLIVQDASGVVFRALDLETEKVVAVRRFFPFGADGGGLHADEQTAYNIAISRLAGLSHPALRSVVCGGCDPVDGMPFIATEWIEGETLEVVLREGPLEADVAVKLLTQALEVSELLSHILAEEAVWVETELQTIVVGSKESGRGFTFWISPLKWLGGDDRSRGLDSIVSLTEEVMGWKGRIVNDQAGRGLGGWVKWLGSVSSNTTLLEARESLAASVGAEPPTSAKNLVVKATTRPLVRPAVPLGSPSSKVPVLAACGVSLLVAAAGAVLWLHKSTEEPAAAISSKLPELAKISDDAQAAGKAKTLTKPDSKAAPKVKDQEEAVASSATAETEEDRRKAEITRMASEAQERFADNHEEENQRLDSQKSAAEQQGGVIQWDHRELLMSNEGKEVTVKGTSSSVDLSDSKKTVYLIFGSKNNGEFFRAGILTGSQDAEQLKQSLETYINKPLRIAGKIEKRTAGRNLFRPELMFTNLNDIKIEE